MDEFDDSEMDASFEEALQTFHKLVGIARKKNDELENELLFSFWTELSELAPQLRYDLISFLLPWLARMGKIIGDQTIPSSKTDILFDVVMLYAGALLEPSQTHPVDRALEGSWGALQDVGSGYTESLHLACEVRRWAGLLEKSRADVDPSGGALLFSMLGRAAEKMKNVAREFRCELS